MTTPAHLLHLLDTTSLSRRNWRTQGIWLDEEELTDGRSRRYAVISLSHRGIFRLAVRTSLLVAVSCETRTALKRVSAYGALPIILGAGMHSPSWWWYVWIVWITFSCCSAHAKAVLEN